MSTVAVDKTQYWRLREQRQVGGRWKESSQRCEYIPEVF
jgi:hypothetical protein